MRGLLSLGSLPDLSEFSALSCRPACEQRLALIISSDLANPREHVALPELQENQRSESDR